MAEGITGAVEVIESSANSKATDATGQTTSSKANTFFQRYQMFYADTLFPYVNLRAGGSFDKTLTVTKDSSGETRSTETNFMPSIDLTLNNPFVSSGAGYRKREEKVETPGVLPTVTNIMESKNAFLGLRPEGLPVLDMQVTRMHIFDKAHETSDTENDSFSASTRYTPVKNLDLAYGFTSLDSNNRITGVEFVTVTQNERAAYSTRLLDNRVVFSANYNGTQSTQTTSSGGTGNVNFQLFPFAGLSSIWDIPTAETLSPNPALIDGNLTTISSVNIGTSVFASLPQHRNVGLDFVNATEVNTLDVFVDRALPAAAYSSFIWNIYISSDNATWTLHQPAATATFDPFTNRFELQFPKVTTRYIKASVTPLSPAVIVLPPFNVTDIFITELQAFISKSAAEAVGKTRATTEFYDVNVRTALLEDRSLYYTFYYSQANSKPGSSTMFLSNALSMTRQLSTVFSGAARVARDDSRDAAGSRLAYSGTASLMAVPLPTVNNSLVLSARTEEALGQTSSTESVFLNNSATLYKGFDVNLSGGVNFASSPGTATGSRTRTKNTIVNAGASIVPNKSLSMSVNHSATESQTASGPNRAGTTTASIAWAPFETVYLAYSFGEATATGLQKGRARNYSASWAPFSSGTLNFSSGYSETRQKAGEGLDKALSFGMEWRVGPRILLTAGYVVSKSRSFSESTDAKSLSTDLRMSF
jgi:hypothetical protein